MATTLLPPSHARTGETTRSTLKRVLAPARPSRPDQRGRAWKLALLAGLLSAHLAVRLHHTAELPISLANRHDYTRTFGHSLSLLLGRGFNDLPAAGAPEAKPIDDFLWMRRGALSWSELEAYAATMPPTSQDPRFGIYGPLASTRVLDIHATALLWRVFGIDWSVNYAAAACASTLCCLLLFLIGRRLGGGFWPGLLAALVFFASPLERFLGAWSIRDTSPLWFASGAFALLICGVDSRSSTARRMVAAAACGFVAGIGAGWRMDSLLLAPFLAVAAGAIVLVTTRRIGPSVAAAACLLTGVAAAMLLIDVLAPRERQATGTGFHMAYYGDAVRSNVLGVENSSQVTFCDMQTLMEARRFDRAANRAQETLPYLSEGYGDVCRVMYFNLPRRNAYRWVMGFPRIWWQALRGYPDDSANFEGWAAYREAILNEGSPSGWRVLDTAWIERTLPHALPALGVLGMAVTVFVGQCRAAAVALGLFSAYFAAVTFAVLPMQKHMAMMLVPTCAFTGIGLWTMVRMLRRESWSGWRDRLSRRGVASATGVATVAFVLWGAAALVARQVSVAERRATLDAVLALALSGQDAPETLKGPRTFHVAIPAGSPGDDVGYLLTVRTGTKPASLVCRHRHIGNVEFRPLVLRTSHALAPSGEQFFFVTCLQGAEFGDPRAYSCTVTVEGDASIAASRRLDLSRWKRLAASTVFQADDASPGSPFVEGRSTRWENAAIPVYGTRSSGPAADADWEGLMFRAPATSPPASVPVDHLAARDQKSGAWRFLISNGSAFKAADLDLWRPHLAWRDILRGDFDGDGVTDLVAREASGGGWWSSSTRDGRTKTVAFGGWSPAVEWKHVAAGDFNGDRIDDVIGYAGGEWWAGLSDGNQFRNVPWGNWPVGRALSVVLTADADGDRRMDLIAFESARRGWTVLFSREGGFEAAESADNLSEPDSACAGDLNGDGRADLLFVSGNGVWVGLSDGVGLQFDRAEVPGSFAPNLVQCADLDGDGVAEPLLVSTADGSILRGRTSGDTWRFAESSHIGTPIRSLVAGDFNGDGRDELAAISHDAKVLVGSDRVPFETWLERLDGEIETDPLLIRSFSSAPKAGERTPQPAAARRQTFQ